MRPALFVTAIMAMSIAACQQQPAEESPGSPADNRDAGPVADAPAPSPTVSPTDTAGIPEMGIPTAIQGNWGMVPADCTSTRGDAKGLLRVSATTLTFYESVGRLGSIKERSDTSIRADYAFAGEGMEWTRDVSLSVDGDTLTRTDRGGGEPGGPFTYTRCG
ncbi:hypothetical protein A6F68_02803 [Tsuneonella dongtanensis]|uniref:Protease inhibitor Inh n=1 Tax=Tsuneonella dongtanensis TaxID=692370 RepID=A0A1B2AGM3_9SPHN|nr:hypothetical protein [Tsuneonella dongtanensis]ANY21292.1 hypothetical protein A6F68_02803 [Tsuneonella dongtanensis]